MSWYYFDERYCEECEKIDPMAASLLFTRIIDGKHD